MSLEDFFLLYYQRSWSGWLLLYANLAWQNDSWRGETMLKVMPKNEKCQDVKNIFWIG